MSAGITKVIKKLRAANESRFLILSVHILYHEHRSRKMCLRQNVERKKKTATPGASLWKCSQFYNIQAYPEN